METCDLDFLTEDIPKLIRSIQMGTNRIAEIVVSLRNFSRLDAAEIKCVDIHDGIESKPSISDKLITEFRIEIPLTTN